MTNNQFEEANQRIVALQNELREIRQNTNAEITNLKVALQQANKLAETASARIKKAEENARNSKERAKRFKRVIERLSKNAKNISL